jgi:hypothetical protein
MAKRIVAWWTIVSLAVAGLALARLAEVFFKRELTRRSASLKVELDSLQAGYQAAANHRDALRVDYASAKAQARIAPGETYLVLRKGAALGRILMGPKVVYEFHFRVRGGAPIRVRGQATELPEGVLSVQKQEEHPAWYRPDWFYERAKATVPKDSAERKIEDAFGRYALSLGGGVAIHGPASKDIPQEAIDHVYVELNERDLKAVYNALKPGSRVLIQR